jgi:hypothetical protein
MDIERYIIIIIIIIILCLHIDTYLFSSTINIF